MNPRPFPELTHQDRETDRAHRLLAHACATLELAEPDEDAGQKAQRLRGAAVIARAPKLLTFNPGGRRSSSSRSLRADHWGERGNSVAPRLSLPNTTSSQPDQTTPRSCVVISVSSPTVKVEATKYEQRALQRAALICLALREPFEAWPRGLVTQWKRLFGERWATTEGGRGLRELVRELGLDGRAQAERERVLAIVNGLLP